MKTEALTQFIEDAKKAEKLVQIEKEKSVLKTKEEIEKYTQDQKTEDVQVGVKTQVKTQIVSGKTKVADVMSYTCFYSKFNTATLVKYFGDIGLSFYDMDKVEK